MIRLTFGVFLMLSASNLALADQYILIGGGPYAEDSEVSIESNVLWINKILRSHGLKDTTVLFASGQGNLDDVQVYNQNRKVSTLQDVLYRVYGKYNERYYDYRHNRVANTPQAATRDNVVKLIKSTLAGPELGTVTIIYNGHGTYEPKNTQENALRLWNKTFFSSNDLRKLIDGHHGGKTLRFVLPQCYSGAFAKVIFKDGNSPQGGIYPNTCGFTSAPDDRQSEGCTPYTNEYEYLDYSTYFFAALDGRTRTGQPLAANPDSNLDGKTSLREAHFYALQQAKSRDIPRSTSEVFLEGWEPWYLKWQTANSQLVDNEYLQAYRNIASAIDPGVNHDGTTYIKRVNHRLIATIEEKKSLLIKLHSITNRERSLQATLKQVIRTNHPDLYVRLNQIPINSISNALPDLETMLVNNSTYQQLIKANQTTTTLQKLILEQERTEGVLRKIIRMHKLGRLQNMLKRYGSAQEIDTYNKLLACESGNLVNH